jgi:hypothetical protein
MLFTMSVFIMPATAATGSGQTLPGLGIWGNNVTLQGTSFVLKSGITSNQSMTLQTSVQDFSQPSNITAGGSATIQSGTTTGTGTVSAQGTSITIQNATIGGSVQATNGITIQSSTVTGTVSTNSSTSPTIQSSSTGTVTTKAGIIFPTVTPAPAPQASYYTGNPDIPSSGPIAGGIYYHNGGYTLQSSSALCNINAAVTVFVNGAITIQNSNITLGSNGSLVLISSGNIIMQSVQCTMGRPLYLWAGGSITIQNSANFSGDIIANGDITGQGLTGEINQMPAPSQVSPPSVTNVNPNNGPMTGGTVVTITGTNFTGATAVEFGTTTLTTTSFTVISNASITTTSPSGTGTVDVTVITPGGTSAINQPGDQFTYYSALSLTATGTNLPTGTVHVPYSSAGITTYVTASGGTGTGYTYSITSTLPAGLSFNNSNNEISGSNPTTPFSGSVTVKVTDSASNTATCTLPLTVNVAVTTGAIVMPVNKQTTYAAISNKYFPITGWYVDTSGVYAIEVEVDNGGWQNATLVSKPTDLPSQYSSYQSSAVDFNYGLDVTQLTTGHHVLYVQEVSDYNSMVNVLPQSPVYINVDKSYTS